MRAVLVALALQAASMSVLAADIEFESTRAVQQAYIAARLREGYSPDATCAAVTRYFGMYCHVERDPCFLGGLCRDENRYIITYGRGVDITYLVTIRDPLKETP